MHACLIGTDKMQTPQNLDSVAFAFYKLNYLYNQNFGQGKPLEPCGCLI